MTAMDKNMITEKYPFKRKNMATQLQKIAAIISDNTIQFSVTC